MKNGDYKIRRMKRSELDIAINWATKEGWNPGLHDAKAFWKTDPKGFFVGLLNNKPIASLSYVTYDNTYCFGGFYIVKSGYRDKGYGMKLFQTVWEKMGDKNKAGDGVVENLKIYANIGLKLAHYSSRYEGAGTNNKYIGENVVPLSKISFTKLTAYDSKIFGFKRNKFLKPWINQPQSFSFGVYKNGEVHGYGVIRKCHVGYKIGPLFANNSKNANELFDTLVGQISKRSKVYLDIPETNKLALKIAKKNKMKKVFTVGRIYTKGQPKFPLNKWYGVTTFELG